MKVYVCVFDKTELGLASSELEIYALDRHRDTELQVFHFSDFPETKYGYIGIEKNTRVLEALFSVADPQQDEYVFALFAHEKVNSSTVTLKVPVWNNRRFSKKESHAAFGFMVQRGQEWVLSRRLFPVKGDGHTSYLSDNPRSVGWLVPRYVMNMRTDVTLGRIHE